MNVSAGVIVATADALTWGAIGWFILREQRKHNREMQRIEREHREAITAIIRSHSDAIGSSHAAAVTRLTGGT